jgi:DNA-binding LacI/PurR family transcriptional regulator
MAQQITIRDVAKKAEVGIGTVSRVLNNSPMVNPATRQRILETIAELGFKPNTIARQLPRKTRIHNIGVITQPFLNYRAFTERLRGVQLALNRQQTNYEVLLFSASSLSHFHEQLITITQNSSVDGLIIIDIDLTPEQKQLLLDSKTPFIGINHFQDQDWPCIGVDNFVGAELATNYLIELGHTTIAYVGDLFQDEYGFFTSTERFTGFNRALKKHNLVCEPNHVLLGKHDYQIAYQLALDLINSPKRPTAIFAMSDLQALACVEAAKVSSLSVPDDLSVVGFDDLEMSSYMGLTTIRQHLEQTGYLALEYVLHRVKGEYVSTPKVPAPELIIRKTTAPP